MAELARYEYNLGPKRPNKPSDRVVAAIQRAVTSALGPGYSFKVISGQENPGHQHGSNRHKTGLAADIQIYDPSGARLTTAKHGNAFMEVAKEFKRLGGLGVGAGLKYMGGRGMHLDMVKPGPGQSNAWGGLANKHAAELEREYRQHMDLGVGESTTALAGLPNDVPTPMPRPPSSYPSRPFTPTPAPTAIASAPLNAPSPDRFGGRGSGSTQAPVMAGFTDPARFGRTPMAPAPTGGRVGSGSFSAPPDPARFGPSPSAPSPAFRMAPPDVPDPARLGQIAMGPPGMMAARQATWGPGGMSMPAFPASAAPVNRSVEPSNPGQLGGVRMSNPVGLGGPGGLMLPAPTGFAPAPQTVQPPVQPPAPPMAPPTMVADMPVHQVEAGAPPMVPQAPRPPASGNTVETDQFGNRSVTNKFGATTITTPGGNQSAGSLNMGQASIPSIPGPLGFSGVLGEGQPQGFGKTLGGGLLGARMGMMGGLPGIAVGGLLGSLLGRELSKPGYGRLGGVASALGIGQRSNLPAFVPNPQSFPAAPTSGGYRGPATFSNLSHNDMRDISPAAADAISRGLGGLY
jgi:hypothetical protein